MFGCGPVAQFSIRSAFLLGAERVIAIDTVPERLRLAETAGAITIDFMAEDVYEGIQELTLGRGVDASIDAVGTEPHTSASFDSMLDRLKVAAFAGTDRPHVLRQAINNTRNFGIVSIIGLYGGFVDKVPMGQRDQSRFDVPHGADAGAALSAQADGVHREGRDRVGSTRYVRFR